LNTLKVKAACTWLRKIRRICGVFYKQLDIRGIDGLVLSAYVQMPSLPLIAAIQSVSMAN
jgi:hypothetical protein